MENQPLIHILIIEDDRRLAQLISEYLQSHGLVVRVETDGERGLREALRHRYDVILLDLGLPGRDGISVCQQLRGHSDIPILITTARGEEADKVLGLEVGADDYIAKPYSPRELLARIRAFTRRMRGQVGPRHAVLQVGGLCLEPEALQATLESSRLDLTSYEFALLYALASNAGQVLSRERLMELARGSSDDVFDRSVDVHISRLRQKLGDNSRPVKMIRTVRGAGYQFVAGGRQ